MQCAAVASARADHTDHGGTRTRAVQHRTPAGREHAAHTLVLPILRSTRVYCRFVDLSEAFSLTEAIDADMG